MSKVIDMFIANALSSNRKQKTNLTNDYESSVIALDDYVKVAVACQFLDNLLNLHVFPQPPFFGRS